MDGARGGLTFLAAEMRLDVPVALALAMTLHDRTDKLVGAGRLHARPPAEAVQLAVEHALQGVAARFFDGACGAVCGAVQPVLGYAVGGHAPDQRVGVGGWLGHGDEVSDRLGLFGERDGDNLVCTDAVVSIYLCEKPIALREDKPMSDQAMPPSISPPVPCTTHRSPPSRPPITSRQSFLRKGTLNATSRAIRTGVPVRQPPVLAFAEPLEAAGSLRFFCGGSSCAVSYLIGSGGMLVVRLAVAKPDETTRWAGGLSAWSCALRPAMRA